MKYIAMTLACIICTAANAEQFPADAGALNVKTFGAKGDGETDDTEAINKAIAASGEDTGASFWHSKIVYFPPGTYLVSSPLMKKYKSGGFGNGLIAIGHTPEDTIIQLKDDADDYQDEQHPRAVFFTSSTLLGDAPDIGGKDYTKKGEGNNAYMNFIENMTIDVGKNNPGAIGIDYLANNVGAIRNVVINAPSGSGVTGIAITRKWPGPALLKNITVSGFKTGIDVANTQYGVTMEDITLSKEEVGLRNDHNMVTVHNLDIHETRQPVINMSRDGLLVITGGKIEGMGKLGRAIQNGGYMNIRGLAVTGYTKGYDGVYDRDKITSPSAITWELPVESPPDIRMQGPYKWVSVTSFGIKPDSKKDATEAIRKALASGGATIYFPHGTYSISDNITIPDTVERIVGMTSTIRLSAEKKPSFKSDQGLFRVKNKKPMRIERMAFETGSPDRIAVETMDTGTVILRDVVNMDGTTLLRPESAGKIFVEDICCGKISVSGKEGVWARQLNTEGTGIRIENKGAPLWVLGFKTQQDCTVLENTLGGKAEMLGGLIFISGTTSDPKIPAFRNINSNILLSYVGESSNPEITYRTHLLDVKNGDVRETDGSGLPKRNNSRMAPQISN